jgi:PAS domain S-box-containing protein
MAPRDPATLEGITAAWQETSEALRESERRYRELVENSLGLICTHDLSGTILTINSASAQSLGYEPGHGVGRNLRDFLAADKRHLFDDYLRRIQENGHDSGMMSVVAQNGMARVWLYRNVLSRQHDGTPYVLGHAIDITDRVEVERSLRHNIEQRETLSFLAEFSDRLSPLVTFDELVSVVQRLPVPFVADYAMVHLRGDGGAVRFVPGPHGNLACEPQLAAAATQLIAADATAVAIESIGGATATLLPLVVDGSVAAVLSLVSERERRLRPSHASVLDEMGRRIRLALDRIQLYREAQEANRLKDEFLSTLSHELRTPLNAIFGWAKILRTRNLDSVTGHAVEVIERNAQTQIRLIEEVLDVSRIITGKMTIAAEPLELRAVVRAALDMVRPGMQAKRIRIEEWLEDVSPVIGDAHRLQQVFWNLLSNALKFTGEGGAITVALRTAGADVEFEICDNGVGIRRDVLPFVFDRFRQADSSKARTHGGLGLGLAIVRHLVELHGGTIHAASGGRDAGSTFRVRLPLMSVHQETPVERRGQPTTAAVPMDPELPDLTGLSVLTVDDDADARTLVCETLETRGARVLAVDSAEKALDSLGRHRADVMITDIGMAHSDGFELIKRVRQSTDPAVREVPAAALTAYARSEDRMKVLQSGFQMHLAKPVDPAELVIAVAALAKRTPKAD